MRTISQTIIISILLFLGVYLFLAKGKNTRNISENKIDKENADELIAEEEISRKGSILSPKRKRDLDQIGRVINEKNVKIDSNTREEIKVAKNKYEAKEGIKELQILLEQSYIDNNSSIKDIKRIQLDISEKKNKLKEDMTNTEKWDPLFVYYLMIQENYTYTEINAIQSLAENGLNAEEIEYIKDLIKEESFSKRVSDFKSKDSLSRTLASAKKNTKKETDDFIDDVNELPNNIEEKLIEMNYNKAEKEEMIYGQNQ